MTSIWSREAVARIAHAPIATLPLIARDALSPILPGYDLWDYWPVQERDGRTASIAGGTLFMLLSAPVRPDPDERHALARIRLMHQTPAGWRDLGNLLPDGFAPGSREWSGSAIIDEAHARLTLYFTAAGQRGEAEPSFDQRLFETSAMMTIADGVPHLHDWSPAIQSVAADGSVYTSDMAGGGEIGTIKAFRDPAWFRDPADGAEYLVFAASLAASRSLWNGAVGLARREGGTWRLCAPLISADGVNNELERPHIIVRNGLYYCFWSTQEKVFAKDAPIGPTGLYGMIADRMGGPWRPLNGTGLVFANPPGAPSQAYSWLVLGDLSVLSFIDRPGLSGGPETVTTGRDFGGTPAVPVHLILTADRAVLR